MKKSFFSPVHSTESDTNHAEKDDGDNMIITDEHLGSICPNAFYPFAYRLVLYTGQKIKVYLGQSTLIQVT